MADRKLQVITRKEQQKQADYQRQHEIALLKLLAPKYPKKTLEIFAAECPEMVINLAKELELKAA